MIRIGIIGAGPNGTRHARYYTSCGRARVVAIADPSLERAEAVAKEVGAKAIGDFRGLLGEVDAVVVASPNFLHKAQAIACAQAGKHLYCEKPLGLSQADALEIAAAVRATGVRSQVGFTISFDAPVAEMLRRHRAGEFGALISTASRRLMWQDPAKAIGWRSDHELSGGLLLEVNIHEIEWMMRAGEVRSVYARMRSTQTGPKANDQIWVVLNYADGAVGSHEGSWRSATPMFYRSMQGTAGGATTNEWGNELFIARNGSPRETCATAEHFDLRGNFLDAIAGEAEAVADVAWGAKVMGVADAILESARRNQVVAIGATATAKA
jgi:predicted dehydrogenase